MLDRLFDALFGDESEEMRAEIRRRYANKETIAEAAKRIEAIALDIAEHFRKKVQPNGCKAQVVAPSRAAALHYTEHLNAFGLAAYPIIHHDQQRRARVPPRAGDRSRPDRQRVHRPGRRVADPRRRRQADHRFRCARRADPLPRPLAPRTLPVASDRPRQSSFLPHEERRHDREDLRFRGRPSRRFTGTRERSRDLRPQRYRGSADGVARRSCPRDPGGCRPRGDAFSWVRPR